MLHKLKISPRFYSDIEMSGKRFEVRRDDRKYQIGDILVLNEFANNIFTGRTIYALVTYIHRNDAQTTFMRDGYIIMGIDIIRIYGGGKINDTDLPGMRGDRIRTHVGK